MRISVRTERGSEPRAFCLGQSRLCVVSILERRESADSQCFAVRVSDGRDFLLLHEAQTDVWHLAAVYGLAKRA
jgi:hypothetical protein